MKMNRFHKQSGATLMEVLVAMTISLVATAAMIAMMSNSLGTTARIIKMTKLTDDMRVALQMMTRDVRRSSYNANSMFCYANENCATDSSGLALPGDVVIADTADCFTFLTDRDHDGDSTENAAGGFRRVTDGDIGVIEMWTGDNAPDCTDDAGAAGHPQRAQASVGRLCGAFASQAFVCGTRQEAQDQPETGEDRQLGLRSE